MAFPPSLVGAIMDCPVAPRNDRIGRRIPQESAYARAY
jgi:hypothetical protein